MAEKQLHDFEDKGTVGEIQAVSTYELLASKSGLNANNVSLASLKTWVLAANADEATEYDLKNAVDDLKGYVNGDGLSISSKSFSPTATGWNSSHPVTVTTAGTARELAQQNSEVAFDKVTSPKVQSAANAETYVSLTNEVITLRVNDADLITAQRSNGVNTTSVAGNLVSTGTVQGLALKAGASGLQFASNEGTLKSNNNVLTLSNRSSGGCELQLNLAAFNFKSTGIYGDQTLITVESDQNETNPAEIRFVEKGGAINSSLNYRGQITAKGDNIAVTRGEASVVVKQPVSSNSSYGRIDLNAPSPNSTGSVYDGVHLGDTTDLTVNSSRKINWRYATSGQDGFMSAAQAAEVAKIAAIEAANGNLTQSLGFQSIKDSSNNERTASSDDRVLNVVGDDNITVAVDTNTANAELSITAPNMATLAGQETLTNKTITGATISGGDVSATKLQGNAVASTTPTEGYILKYVSGSWTPSAPAAQAGDPSFSDGSAAAPSVTFDNDTDTGLFSDSGVSVAVGGSAVAKFQANQIESVEAHRFDKGVKFWKPADSGLLDLKLRSDNTGIGGGDGGRKVRVRVESSDVVEFRSNSVKFSGGIQRSVKRCVADEQLSEADEVVFCSGDCTQVTLPRASTSVGQIVTIAAVSGAASTISAGKAAASQVNIYGFLSGSTRDAVDSNSGGIKIVAGESAMLVCDGEKWVRVGIIGGGGKSTSSVDTAWSALSIDFNSQNSGSPSMVNFYGAADVSKHNVVTARATDVALFAVNGETPTGITLSGVNFNSKYLGDPTVPEVRGFVYGTTADSDISTQPYFILNKVPAGSYKLYYVSAYYNVSDYNSRAIISELDAQTGVSPNFNSADSPYDNSTSKYKYLTYSSQRVVKVLGYGNTCFPINGSLNYTRFKAQDWVKGITHGEVSFTVDAEKSIVIQGVNAVSFSALNMFSHMLLVKES